MKKHTRFIAMLLAAVLIASMLSACAGKSAVSADSSSGQEPAAPAENSSTSSENQAYNTDTTSKDYSGRTLRILLSIGGGGNYYEPIAKRMMELYPGLTVEIEYSNTAADVLRTQILSGNPPDIYNVNSGTLPWYDAIEQGIAKPIDEIFELPTMDGTQKLGDLMDMSMFSLGQYEGHYYVMHEFQYLNGLWYDAAYFRENNLTVPKDWDSLVELAGQAGALGKKLLGYMGIAADEYGVCYWLWPMIASTDYEMYKSIMNLDYEAIKSDSMKRVVEKMAFVRDGNYDINTLGCGATEAQIAFINHDHLLYPCGSWLEAEMEGAWTDGWELTFLPYSFGDEESDPAYMRLGGLASMVSPDTKNWDLVCEFYRLMFSDDQAIHDSVSVHRNVMIIPGFSEKYGDLVDPSVNTAAACMDQMSTMNNAIGMWYPEINVGLGNIMNAFCGGDIDEDEFIQRFYDLVKSVAEDDSITKYAFEG